MDDVEQEGDKVVTSGDDSKQTVVKQSVSEDDNTQMPENNVPHHPPQQQSSSTTTTNDDDSGSIQSLPALQVTPDSPAPAPSPPPSALPQPPSSASATASALSPAERRLRHRSAIEPRSSNRLSGFFTNLIHRREPNREESQPPPRSPAPVMERPPSPSQTPPRSSTPPPTLPPPSLLELGLSLSVVTNDLSPSHFSTPPTSGAFLSPHFLLLCHAQGLDVLPLVSPPAPQPYALVRRVAFKSVVVMEQRGVLVAIAGRRDGVRVYALEEVKRAVEWRIDVEVRRERERNRREMVKKIALGTLDGGDMRDLSSDKSSRKGSLSTPPLSDTPRGSLNRKDSSISVPGSLSNAATTPTQLIPRHPTIKRRPKTPKTQQQQSLPVPAASSASQPSSRPPSYSAESPNTSVMAGPSISRARSGSISNVLGAATDGRTIATTPPNPDAKPDWDQSSDDEAINIVAAGSSGSQALDERTSAQPSSPPANPPANTEQPSQPRLSMSSTRRNRPANLDLGSLANGQAPPPPEPSPVPTVWTLRQALAHSPIEGAPQPDTPNGEQEEDGDTVDGRISLAQALLESRLPDLPPAGSERPQQPILIASHPIVTGEEEPNTPRTSESVPIAQPTRTATEPTPAQPQPKSRRRRWSVMLTQSITPSSSSSSQTNARTPSSTTPVSTPATTPSRERPANRLTRSQSHRSNQSARTVRPTQSQDNILPSANGTAETATQASSSSGRSRFLPRIISHAFGSKNKEEREVAGRNSDSEIVKRSNGGSTPSHAPPPKLEYVKLPGTKGALMIKAVETPKKSFLAILCGESGEKVELFAGTYRTALGLSRTFILPDSPRSLELQLQGDDLVEVFLVFSQNVFGLEPATVRVREVRIGRAERRAARRRAREIRGGDQSNTDPDAVNADEDTNINVSIGVSVSVGSNVVASGETPDPEASATLIPTSHPSDQPANQPTTPNEAPPNTAAAHAEELVALATAQMGPYTTFQQLAFAPRFPLASIADDYIIPPTYPDFLVHRAASSTDPSSNDNSQTPDLTQIQFSPPGLPVPAPSAPSKWFYRDPKNVVHGPWKASLMQAWYKDGLLPPDLPVRREEETDYMLLRDLRQQCVDPTHPFRSPPALPSQSALPAPDSTTEPLLAPISLLAQPKHFGPPALFFSSRGGHSTTIVDARGRSVLKGRFMWSEEEKDNDAKTALMGRMGDVKRIEAFDVRDKSVLVAMRQGGLEAVDLSDALLKPADESRTALPQFDPPPSNVNRRKPFVWKIGTPVSASPNSATVLSSKKPGLSHHLPGKKQSTGPSKSPAGKTEFSLGDLEESQDEVLYLGRKDDELYLCERNAGFFRILRLCPAL